MATGFASLAIYTLFRAISRLFWDGGLDLTPIREVLALEGLETVLAHTFLAVGASAVCALTLGSLLAWLNERTHLEALEQGWVVPADQLPLPDGFPSDFVDPDLGPVIGHPLAVTMYNTDLVAEDEVPSTWEDLADPRWNGEILMADLDEQVWHVGVYGTVIEEFGEEWAEGFMATEPRVVSGAAAPLVELIAAGEAAIAPIGYAPMVEALKASGAPIDYTLPEPQTAVPSFVAINSEAENPNAARLFYHYIHTEDGVARLTLFGTHAPYQTDREYTWVPDDLRWVTDEGYVADIRGLLGQ